MQRDIDSEFTTFIAETCAHLDNFDKLSEKAFRLVVRRTLRDGTPVIVKLWARPGLKGALRRLMRQSSARYEWRNLKLLEEIGVPAPRSIGYTKIAPNPSGYTDAMAMEDLGDCETAVRHIKSCVARGDTASLEAFEHELIRITVTLVRAKVIDFDHSLVNFLVKDGKPYRIDVEKARIVPLLGLRPDIYSKMVGQLLATYVFAVQPSTFFAERFADQLLKELKPSRKLVHMIQNHLNFRLEMQKKKTNIDTLLDIRGL